ncbi:MAG TPA: hypothetical protein VKQ08_09650 [Cyclobacteriaceae bacterium]|nr:hypothetical protein [Cyclobacteriaceae bacterium]
MAKKPLSVGVKSALIGAGAVIIAALLALLHHSTPTTSQIINNSPGATQVIQGNGNQQTNPPNDTVIAKSYDDKFESMTQKRTKAAIAIQEYLSKGDWNQVTNNTDGLDDVLGLFEIMGYDEQHGLISPDVLHEYFYEDIAAYYQASTGYIAMVQKSDGAATYANLKPLYNTMIKIEAEKEHTNVDAVRWEKADLINYFQSETNSVNQKENK